MFIFQLPAISGVRSKLPLVEVVIAVSFLGVTKSKLEKFAPGGARKGGGRMILPPPFDLAL
ncbi:hypothetical protein [Arthrobacter sp. HLT1-20]